MMKPRLLPLAGLALAGTLAGCGVLPGLPLTGEVPGIAVISVGDCLDGMIGYDSDRNAVVDCGQPHLYDVTAIDEWPGLGPAIEKAGQDAGAVWDDIHRDGGGTDYWQWASETCDRASQRLLGIADIVVGDIGADDIGLSLGGQYGIDLSLPSRAGFLAGDHRTVCSVAWYDGGGNPRLITYPVGLGFADLTDPGFGIQWRECWGEDFQNIRCEQPHLAQVLATFDGLAAFGAEIVERAGAGEPTEEDWATVDDFCTHLVSGVLPGSADLGGLDVIAEAAAGYAWDEFRGTVNPDYGYPFSCLAVDAEYGLIDGDVFAGTAHVQPGGGEGA